MDNQDPAFDDGETNTPSVAENTAANTGIGTPSPPRTSTVGQVHRLCLFPAFATAQRLRHLPSGVIRRRDGPNVLRTLRFLRWPPIEIESLFDPLQVHRLYGPDFDLHPFGQSSTFPRFFLPWEGVPLEHRQERRPSPAWLVVLGLDRSAFAMRPLKFKDHLWLVGDESLGRSSATARDGEV